MLAADDTSNVGYSLQAQRPQTAMHRDLESECVPLIGVFLSAICHSLMNAGNTDPNKVWRATPAALHEVACAGKIYGRRTYSDNIVRFGRHVTKILGPDCKSRGSATGGTVYHLTYAGMLEKLKEAHMYVPDVELPSVLVAPLWRSQD